MQAMAPAMRAWMSQDAATEPGIAIGSVSTPPRPVTNPAVKFFVVSHRISASTRASSLR
jgi:hypothetical protein